MMERLIMLDNFTDFYFYFYFLKIFFIRLNVKENLNLSNIFFRKKLENKNQQSFF